MTQTLRRVAVIGGVRTPFCRSNTLYAELSNLDLMTQTLQGLVDRYNLKGVRLGEVTGGAVVTHSKDWNLAREAVIGTTLSPQTPGVTMMQACGTSLQAAAGIAAKIAAGYIDAGVAIGSDTTSDAPIVFSKRFSTRLTQLAQQKSTWDRVKVFKGLSAAELAPQPPSTNEPRTGLSMGQHTELMAKQWQITREAQDELALASHKNAAAAYRSGWMDDLLVPCGGAFKDNNLREDATIERLAALRPAFDKTGSGTLTAGNSTPLTDGASAVLLASEEWAASRGLQPQAYLTYFEDAALDFVAGEGLLMAPTIAVSRMLERANLRLQDFDFYEIHEAFAAQVLATLKAWEDPQYCRDKLGRSEPMGAIERGKMNVMGSSLAVGHPFAATGARIVGTLAKLLDQHGGRGLISICTAGGMGVAAILESARSNNGRQSA